MPKTFNHRWSILKPGRSYHTYACEYCGIRYRGSIKNRPTDGCTRHQTIEQREEEKQLQQDWMIKPWTKRKVKNAST